MISSIFVNPTQFNNPEDLEKYPRNIENDIRILKESGFVDAVYIPEVADLYPEIVESREYDFDGLENEMEGKFRPGHFNGVGTVVEELLRQVHPDNAYFGEKDYQQLAIIRQLVAALNFPIDIIGAEIVRAEDGLALSSRNQYLSSDEREKAPLLQKTLKQLAAQLATAQVMQFDGMIAKAKDHLNQQGFNVDYLSVTNRALQPPMPEDQALVILVAAWLGERARLLDNLEFSRA